MQKEIVDGRRAQRDQRAASGYLVEKVTESWCQLESRRGSSGCSAGGEQRREEMENVGCRTFPRNWELWFPFSLDFESRF